MAEIFVTWDLMDIIGLVFAGLAVLFYIVMQIVLTIRDKRNSRKKW